MLAEIKDAVVSTHSRPKAAVVYRPKDLSAEIVSTHSRPKAAELHLLHRTGHSLGFNTQPPEGG